jgi:hypothetical protein
MGGKAEERLRRRNIGEGQRSRDRGKKAEVKRQGKSYRLERPKTKERGGEKRGTATGGILRWEMKRNRLKKDKGVED